MKSFTRKWLAKGMLLAGVCLVLSIGVSIYVGRQLTAPAPRLIGPAPDRLRGETVSYPSDSGSTIEGWLAESDGAAGCVLLLHGIRADRRSMASRARFLRDLGYHALCIDLQAHGQSLGSRITLGYLESKDAAAGVAFLRERYPGLPIAVIGSSLGGASALMADYDAPPEAIVVESVFSNAETAIGNRLAMRLGSFGRWLTPLLAWQIRPSLGIDPAAINPARSAESVAAPVFVVYGEEDRHARPSEAKTIHAALIGRKEIWGIAGAAHVDLHRHAGAEYEKKIARFIESAFRERDRPQ